VSEREYRLLDPVQAGTLLKSTVLPMLKADLVAGRRQVLIVRDWEEAKTEKQRHYYHGYILTEIARQARANGEAYPMPVWKEFFRAKYLGTKRKTHKDPMTGRKVWRSERVSTEHLGVKAYNKLIEQVAAFAVTELNVDFSHTIDSWIDPETGEIVG
jgi:hypothetical protein